MLAAAAVVRDTRVSLKGRACAAGCLKLYMARTPQELVTAGVATNSTAAGTVPSSASGAGPLGTASAAAGPGPSPRAAEDAAGSLPQGSGQPALVPAASPGGVVTLGGSSAGLSMSSPAPAPQKKAKPPVGRTKQTTSAEAVSFALGWFADSGGNDGEERLWLEEQMLVADGVKEKVGVLLNKKPDYLFNPTHHKFWRQSQCLMTMKLLLMWVHKALKTVLDIICVALPEWLRG